MTKLKENYFKIISFSAKYNIYEYFFGIINNIFDKQK